MIERILHQAEEWRENPNYLLELEKEAASSITEVIRTKLPGIKEAFKSGFTDLYPLWGRYEPKQRGKKPTGLYTPMGDLAEKVLGISFIAGFLEAYGTNAFLSPISLPYGGDYRWIAQVGNYKFALHVDIKATGPNDNPDELVVPTNQITGFPKHIEELSGCVINETIKIGARKAVEVVPTLPALITYKSDIIPQVTVFLKIVYRKEGEGGHQEKSKSGLPLLFPPDQTKITSENNSVEGIMNSEDAGEKTHDRIHVLDRVKMAVFPNAILLSGHYKGFLSGQGGRATPFNMGKDAHEEREDGNMRFRISLSWLQNLDPEKWRVQEVLP